MAHEVPCGDNGHYADPDGQPFGQPPPVWAAVYPAPDNLIVPPGFAFHQSREEDQKEVNFCLLCHFSQVDVLSEINEPELAASFVQTKPQDSHPPDPKTAAGGEQGDVEMLEPLSEDDIQPLSDSDESDSEAAAEDDIAPDVTIDDLIAMARVSIGVLRRYMKRVVKLYGPAQACFMINWFYDKHIRKDIYWFVTDKDGKNSEVVERPAWTRNMIHQHMMRHSREFVDYQRSFIFASALSTCERVAGSMVDENTGLVDIKNAELALKYYARMEKMFSEQDKV